LAGLARAHPGLVLAVARDSHSATALENDLRVLAGDLPIVHFPDWETLPYDLFSPHPDIVSQRVAALYRLPSVERGVLVVPVSSLMQRLPPPSWIAGIEYYLPLFFEHTASLFEHLSRNALLVLGEGVPEAAAAFWAQASDRYEQRRHDLERPILPPQEIFLPPDALRESINRVPTIE